MPDVLTHNAIQLKFFEALFGSDQEGYVCISRRRQGERSWTDAFFYWHSDIPRMMEYIEKNYRASDMYVCTTLQSEPSRKARYATVAYNVWADLDTCEPSKAKPVPTIVLETSPGRYHGFWPLTHAIPAKQASNYSKRMAYELAADGADKSGWDVSQVLRIPYTLNFKYPEKPVIEPTFHWVEGIDGTEIVRIDPQVFNDLPSLPETSTATAKWQDLPGTGDLPSYDFVYDKYWDDMSVYVKERHSVGVDDGDDWSAALYREMAELFQLNASLEEAMAFAQKSAVNKFSRDNRGEIALWEDILRIHHKVTQQQVLESQGKEIPAIEKPTDTWEPGFIEEYIQWAQTVTDAPQQYHEAGAFIILSSMLGSTVELETSLGDTKLNMWIMVLGETTLTRKSTSMNLAMRMIAEVDDDVLLGTEEGSIEGLLDALRSRPHMASVFHRDEVVGMLKGVAKRDHMSGMLETYAKLYDGKTMRRNLRKESIIVTDPVFIFFAGGIKQSFFDNLGQEHMESGFLPRFLYVSGQTALEDLKPISRKKHSDYIAEERMIKKLNELHEKYHRSQIINVAGHDLTKQVIFKCDPTDEALLRYNEFERTLLKYAQENPLSNSLMPMMARTAINTLKMAALMAATRNEPNEDDRVPVELEDINHAIYYVNKWMPATLEVVRGAGMPATERRLTEIYDFIDSHEDGVGHSVVMRQFHLSSYEIKGVMETLIDRQFIRRIKKGKGSMYYAT